MNVPMLKAIHEARRASGYYAPEFDVPFGELDAYDLEMLKAEVAAYVQDGAEPEPLLKAIVDALK